MKINFCPSCGKKPGFIEDGNGDKERHCLNKKCEEKELLTYEEIKSTLIYANRIIFEFSMQNRPVPQWAVDFDKKYGIKEYPLYKVYLNRIEELKSDNQAMKQCMLDISIKLREANKVAVAKVPDHYKLEPHQIPLISIGAGWVIEKMMRPFVKEFDK